MTFPSSDLAIYLEDLDLGYNSIVWRHFMLIAIGQNLYFYLNHPIKWIRLVGVIIAVDIHPSRWILILDDGSGATLEITCGRPKPANHGTKPVSPATGSWTPSTSGPPTEGLTATGRKVDLSDIDIGTVVKVKGGIGNFRDAKQLLLERISILRTTNEEVAAWDEDTTFRKDILSIPWHVERDEEERARKRAEGLEREERARWKRKRDLVDGSGKHVKSSNAERKCVAARQDKGNKSEVHHSIVERAKLEEQKIKPAEEKKLRKQVFEKSKVQKENAETAENRKGVQDEAALASEERPKDRGIMRMSTHSEKKEQAKIKRVKERQSRELEYQRLKRITG